jgi:hypothetical protein
MKNKMVTAWAAAVLFAGASITQAYLETFDTNSTNVAADYPQFSRTGNGLAQVISQQLVMTNGSNPIIGFTTTNVFSTDHYVINLQMTDTGGTPANHAVGLFLGNNTPVLPASGFDNNIWIHPGSNILRVEGPGGFGNVNVGFTIPQGVMSTIRVDADGVGNFNFILTSGTNTYANGWFNSNNTSFKAGAIFIDFAKEGVISYFDNLSVIPEPSTLFLLGAALVFILHRVRRG